MLAKKRSVAGTVALFLNTKRRKDIASWQIHSFLLSDNLIVPNSLWEYNSHPALRQVVFRIDGGSDWNVLDTGYGFGRDDFE